MGVREKTYQLALFTPGNLPSEADLRKQRRQMPKRRKNPRGRPHKLQRLRSFTVGNLPLAAFTRRLSSLSTEETFATERIS